MLIKNSGGQLQRRRKIGVGRTGTRSPRCSGFRANQRYSALVHVHYVHDEGDDAPTSERIEAVRHRQIQSLLQALLCNDLLIFEGTGGSSPDGSLCAHRPIPPAGRATA
ncbi:hypothetical protein OG883_42945 [Streptomyces sp. NBC_01142]|uniref:hypothetical protein n=1 Tax=Streptomyces sp. NBC_01142 TaxID=2975865 RepID=UPI002257CEA6|nr:hypothetical protein [Streptomyces sp. NBC_01142]MCX4826402.1 hypothetical protein [Streptomyces sp. NBC_01142]